MNWRRRKPTEIDHELLWLSISSAAFLGAVLWLRLGLPRPVCLFHEVTHHACLTCGATMQAMRVAGRTSTFCPRCQPAPASRR